MTPRFAEAVDPILLHVFSLLERIDSGAPISPSEEKRQLLALIQQADAKLANTSSKWELAKYALVAWIDEMLVDAHIWPGQNWWRENVMEWTLFQMRRCNDLYYVQATTAAHSSDDDALEGFYVFVLLGFRGLYRDPLKARVLIDKHGLPRDLPSWADDYASAVQQARRRTHDAVTEQCERTITTALPLWKRSFVVWLWLLAAIVAGLNVLCYYYFVA